MTEYEVSCLGKARFTTRKAAKRRASQIRREGGPSFRIYHCRYCAHWHCGHRTGEATYLRTTPHGPIHIREIAS
ncbi:hypothetical protein [Streptomyces sp. NPDC060366]|uniref:hypothetical protein n=1 Tax=Streptomyces sp. NPDC060366 TaxID=3347105 RepID=UPI003658FCD8